MDDEAASCSYAAAADFDNEQANNANEHKFYDCKYSKYGCITILKSKRHKSNKSKHCLYHGLRGDVLSKVLQEWEQRRENDPIDKNVSGGPKI